MQRPRGQTHSACTHHPQPPIALNHSVWL
jgi:hypothetical protein